MLLYFKNINFIIAFGLEKLIESEESIFTSEKSLRICLIEVIANSV